MTPLAHMIAREMTLPIKRRTLRDEAGITKRMDDVHCFELSQVYHLALEMAGNVERITDGPLTSFLPAPKTWIEWKLNDDRLGLLLEEHPDDRAVIYLTDVYYSPGQDCFRSPCWFGLRDMFHLHNGLLPTDDERSSGWYRDGFHPHNLIPAFLLLINSPKVIGRRQHMPHRGLERALTSSMMRCGKFPLHAWTEIKLEVAAPKWAGGNASTEAHLTGEKALHFCRSHIRIRLGRLEIVRSHWRGDPALGIKRSRYVVEPPKLRSRNG